MRKIASRDNPTYRALYRLVRSPRQQREQGRLILEGLHLLESYTAAFGIDGIEVVLRESQAQRPDHLAWARRCRDNKPLVLADALFDRMSAVETPSGILALANRRPSAHALGSTGGFAVLLDGVQDPGNLGSIIRSAAAAGGSTIFLSADCADPWSAKALRGGMGGQFAVTIREREDLTAIARAWKGPVLAANASAPNTIYQTELPPHTAFLFGSEGQGLRADLLASASQQIAVPLEPSIESLNVSAAAAVCFFEWRRRMRCPTNAVVGRSRAA